MNVKIKELLDWAKDHARIYVIECELANIPVDQEEHDRRFQEKFAELIVRECAELMPQDNLYKMVLKRFGVEE